jgi:hypothetical protein
VLTTSEGGTIGQGVALVSSSDSLPHHRVHFRCKTLLYQIMNKKLLYFILRAFNLWFVYAFLCILASARILRQDPD